MSIEDNTIRLFMWGYQHVFSLAVQLQANELFLLLDPEFEVTTTLVGLSRSNSPERHPVCLEPEDCEWSTDDFNDVRGQVEHFLAVDGEENLIAMDPGHQKTIQRRRLRRAENKAVMAAIQGWRQRVDTQYFFSGFLPVGEYDVGVILKIAHRSGTQHYRLPKTHAEERFQVPLALPESVARIFLSDVLGTLHVPDPENVAYFKSTPQEVLRRAGDWLMQAPNFATHAIEGLYGLFNACNYIASLSYEGAATNGGMIIARSDHSNVSRTITLAQPVRLSQHRAIRKLLEVSSTGISLLTDGTEVFGFGRTKDKYDQSRSDLFQVQFTGHHKWTVFHEEHKLMEVEYGLPRLPIPPLNESKFQSTFEIIFGKNALGGRRAYELSLEACRQRHGTVLVFTPDAESEAIRLKNQATLVAKFEMTPEILRNVSAIDGAVILNLDSICFAIGAILDGMAVPNGNPSRGARFNSALRYAHAPVENQSPRLVVVVSEDGMAEIVPDLPSRISKAQLDEKLRNADELLNAEKWSLDKSFPLINWFEKKRFYLSEQACEKVNAILSHHNRAIEESRGLMVTRQEFRPDPQMSEVFFF